MNESVIHIRSVVGEDVELQMQLAHHIMKRNYWFCQRVTDRMKENCLNLIVIVGICVRLKLLGVSCIYKD